MYMYVYACTCIDCIHVSSIGTCIVPFNREIASSYEMWPGALGVCSSQIMGLLTSWGLLASYILDCPKLLRFFIVLWLDLYKVHVHVHTHDVLVHREPFSVFVRFMDPAIRGDPITHHELMCPPQATASLRQPQFLSPANLRFSACTCTVLNNARLFLIKC